jgi:hypothetical protein
MIMIIIVINGRTVHFRVSSVFHFRDPIHSCKASAYIYASSGF